MTSLPVGFKWTSGKNAMIGSFADYLKTQITDENFEFDNPILPVKLPGYGVVEMGLYNLGVHAFDNLLGLKADGSYLYGRKNQTLVEISAWDDETLHPDAVGKVRQMRDKIVYVLYNAGRTDDNGNFILPPMKVYNYFVNPKVEIGVITLDDSDNAINEKFIIDPSNQNLKCYKLIVRLFWFEYQT